MTTDHAELCECDCLNYCGDDPDLPKRKARPCLNAIDRAHEQALEIEAERERQRKVDLFESQAARIAELEADCDCWRDQCAQRVADWDEMRKERDALKADAERYRWAIASDENATALYVAVFSCGPNAKNSIDAEMDAAIQAEKETR